MLYVRFGFGLSALLLVASPSFARDDVLVIPIVEAMNVLKTLQKPESLAKLCFGIQSNSPFA